MSYCQVFYDFIIKYTDMREASHIFPTKNISIFEIVKFEILSSP